MNQPVFIFISALAALALTAPSALAQTSPLRAQKLTLENLKIQPATDTADSTQNLDLLAEVKRQNPALAAQAESLDLNHVELILKSAVGGASAYLVVDGQFVDGQVVESDFDQKTQVMIAKTVTLKNIERRLQTAVLQIIGQATLESVTVVFGAVSDVALIGSYANAEAATVASAGPAAQGQNLVRPPKDVVRPNGVGTYPVAMKLPDDKDFLAASATISGPALAGAAGSSAGVVSSPSPALSRPVGMAGGAAVAKATKVARPLMSVLSCYRNYCVGDTIANRFGFEGRILSVNAARGSLLIEFDGQSVPISRRPEQVIWKHRST